MSSKVEIGNLALSHCGSKARIGSFSEQTTEAHHINLHYDPAVRVILEQRDWGFAEAVATLALTTDTAPGDLLYTYALPNNCLTPLWLNHELGVVDPPEYRIGSNGTQRVIYTNEEEAELVYTKAIEGDPTQYTQSFVEAVAVALAVRICLPLTGDRALRAELQKAATATLSNAGAQNANSEPNLETSPECDWLEARR